MCAASNVSASVLPAVEIALETARQGPIPFSRFMELALYCPGTGYYERKANSPGRRGDYYTGVNAGALLGELMAFQMDIWARERPGETFQVVEGGAHDGRLAEDALKWWRERRPALLERLEYWILEPSASRRTWQQERLGRWREQVRWASGWCDLVARGVSGVVVSNELLDAFPLERLGWDAGRKSWFRWGVGLGEAGGFRWERLAGWAGVDPWFLPVVPPALAEVLPDGFTVEVSPGAVQWWRAAARVLRRGRLWTFDYGLEADEWLAPSRSGGSLRAYRAHRLVADPLESPGEQDLTAHVNWSHIRLAGEEEGLVTEAWGSQGQFLTRLASRVWEEGSAFGEWTAKQTRQFQTLTHPAHLGMRFQVLVQRRID